MALVLKDRVKETTTTTGTGVITLDGALNGFQAFDAVGNYNQTYYTITDNTNWEAGIGTFGELEASPVLSLNFDETTTLDSSITFTRATNGTYFDSNGTLQTASSGVARFNHRLENGVWVNKGLLIEEARTNYAGNSQSLSQTFTGSNNGSLDIVDATSSNNNVTAPDGTLTGGTLTKTATSGRATTYLNSPGATKNTRFTFSCFLRANTLTTARLDIVCQTATTSFGYRINCTFTLDGDGSFGSISYGNAADGTAPPQDAVATIQKVSSLFYRCSISGTSYNGPNTLNATLFEIRPTPASASGSIRVWGRMIEVGDPVTSYIRTTSLTAVARNADVVSMTGTNFSDWYNATEGTVFCQFNSDRYNVSAASVNAFNISDGTVNERIQGTVFYSAPNDLFSNRIFDANVLQAALDESGLVYVPNRTYKNAVAVKANDFAASTEGLTALKSTSPAAMPSVNRIAIGSSYTGAGQICGHIEKLYYWNTRLSDGTLRYITGSFGSLSVSRRLTRDTVLASSNSGNLVNFSAGTKTVFSPLPAIATQGSSATADDSSIGTDLVAWNNFKKLLNTSVIGGVAYGNNGTNGIVSTYSLVTTGTTFYLGGVLTPNGDVHFVPFSATRGQKISASNVVSTYSLIYTTAGAYVGGVLSPNGDIHFVPQSAPVGQKISASGVVSTYSLVYTQVGGQSYQGGVLAPNGDIYFVPLSAAVGQKISAAGVVSTYSLVYTTTTAYSGGVLATNGDIHFVPANAAVGQKISASGVVSTYSLVYTATSAYVGGVIAPNGDIYFVPRNAAVGQKVSTTGVVSTYSLVYTTTTSYVGGVLAPNGDIHFVPRSAVVGQKVSASGVVSTYSLSYTAADRYAGGILRTDGSIVFVPFSAAVGQIISTNPGIALGQEACLSSYLNKY